jgi:hypothetical protein
MDGVFTQCPAVSPVTGRQCVRLAGTHEEHQDQQARDVYCHRWIDTEE